ncbi:MAG: glycosyl hydrolase [Pyrinomonadaceae bacterium]
MNRSLLLALISGLFAVVSNGQWVKQHVTTTASFRGLSVVSQKIVWASGTGGTVIKSTDGGATWKVMTVPGAEKLDFRDIEAFDTTTAYVLSIGNGESSRVYQTTDGGDNWREVFRNTNEKAFFDAIGCWGRQSCLAMSDPVDGQFMVRQINFHAGGSSSGGLAAKIPPARAGEAAFAASGTCLITLGGSTVFMVSGGNDARVFRSNDRGLTWEVFDTPMTKGTPGSGIFSIAFRNKLHGTIVGGNYEKPDDSKNNLAFTRDGGKTWYEGEGLTGYRSAVTYIDDKTIIAVGTNGTDISTDRGAAWKKIGSEDLNAVAAKGMDAVWAVGPKGGVYRMARQK